jgi:hypothetical protein
MVRVRDHHREPLNAAMQPRRRIASEQARVATHAAREAVVDAVRATADTMNASLDTNEGRGGNAEDSSRDKGREQARLQLASDSRVHN